MANQDNTVALTSLIDQSIHTIPSFTLECGRTLKEVPIAYKTWGTLNTTGDNVMIICHAFTGSADVEDWWGPLIGRGKAFDPNRFFIFCANVLGSPYGSASPITLDPDTGKPYGPEFPPTTIRDDVRFHKLVLDHLGVTSVAVAIGGSMGGMAVLEWPLCSPEGYIRHVVPLATSARHSAWCISWGEAQRQSIYSDPMYQDGFYYIESGKQPATGLAAARMSALLTYRSRDSFERRFGRKPQLGRGGEATPPGSPTSPADDAWAVHNDGHRNAKPRITQPPSPTLEDGPQLHKLPNGAQQPQVFSAQSYLRYQGDKFTARFDANCYIHITRKMDTHDVARGRRRVSGQDPGGPEENESQALARVLSTLPPRALVISIETDGLFTTTEQKELAAHIPQAELVVIPSEDGHDGFLLEFERINEVVSKFLRREYPEMYENGVASAAEHENAGFEVKKNSVFGEAEVDITSW
ncbi:Alpha/Beta hydrolase protein [Collybia nuda]|uniref:Alpha/Beta hydrolase protein n=1 Tax=Collybia nuda TaxID=64659 RepID=A0A9P5Y4G3_9AGAR|nr:Alpha/Beta hydrolase protein [Collybia nuda]